MLDESVVNMVLRRALRDGGDFAEVYFEVSRRDVLAFEDGKLEKVTTGRDMGVGVRLLRGDTLAYAFTDDVSEGALMEVAATVAAVGRAGGQAVVVDLRHRSRKGIHRSMIPPDSVEKAAKAEFVRRADGAARKVDPHIRQVQVAYSDVSKKVVIANSEGLFAEDERSYVRLGVTAVAAKDGEIQIGSKKIGLLGGLELLRGNEPERVGEEAARQALTNLFAAPSPAGRFTVVMTNGWGGVLFHEACGHGLEADAVQKKASVFAGRIGERVASDVVTAFDDSTIVNGWGSFEVDDEGQSANKTLLIEKGILRGYMYDIVRARKENGRTTGNGRRGSYQFMPIPRMTNTYIAPGDVKPEEIIAATKYGFYAKDLRGGQVNPTTGDFVFTVSEGYMIRDGKIAEPVRGATLIGNGPAVLMKIDMVADDLEFGPGVCGKDGQGVPAACGQPTLRITELTVGGTSHGGGGGDLNGSVRAASGGIGDGAPEGCRPGCGGGADAGSRWGAGGAFYGGIGGAFYGGDW